MQVNKYIISGINGNVGKLLVSYFDNYDIFDSSLKFSNADIFIHLASKSYGNYEEIIKSNIDYLVEAIEFCKQNNIKNFIFFSAFSINNKDDFYSKSKLFGEYILRESGLNVLVLRLPMILTQEATNGILNRIIDKLEHDKIVDLYNANKKFNNFISIDSICSFIINYSFNTKFEIISLQTADELTLYEIVLTMKKILNSKSDIRMIESKFEAGQINFNNVDSKYECARVDVNKILIKWILGVRK